MNYFLYACYGSLLLLGVVYFSEIVAKWIFRPKNLPKVITVIPVKGGIENIEQIWRFVEVSVRWEDFPADRRSVILVDMGLDGNTKESCEILCRSHLGLRLCTPQTLNKYL